MSACLSENPEIINCEASIVIKFPIKLGILLLAAVSAGVLWQQAQLSVLALSRIDPLPETRMMIAEERYAEAADYLVVVQFRIF